MLNATPICRQFLPFLQVSIFLSFSILQYLILIHIGMRHSYLFVGYCLAALVASTINSVQARRDVVVDDSIYVKLVPRGGSRGSSPTRESSPTRGSSSTRESSPTRGSSSTRGSSPTRESRKGSSSGTQRQKSPDRMGDWKGTSSATQPIPPTTRSQSPPPSRLNSSGTQRLRAKNPLAMTNGPIRIQSSQTERKRIANIPPRQPYRLDSPPPIPSLIGGHPNSAIVVVKGPAYIQGQTASGHTEVANVPTGMYDHIALHDERGAFVIGRTQRGGRAVAATTGNAVAGYAAVHHTATGFVETHDGPTQTWQNVTPGEEYRKFVRGDGSGKVKGAALAGVNGHGQVTAVAMERETDGWESKYG